jgi:hypothetical protein
MSHILPAGTRWPRVLPIPSQHMFSGPEGERLPLMLEIGSGETIRRDLMLRGAVSVIEGVVQRAGGPQAGAFVLLMPANPPSGGCAVSIKRGVHSPK